MDHAKPQDLQGLEVHSGGEEQLHRMVWLSCYEKSSSSCIDGGAGRVCWYNMIDDVVRSGLGLFWVFFVANFASSGE